MPRVPQVQKHLVEREVVRLREEGVQLAKEWSRVPWLAASIVLVVPCYLIWGATVMFYGVLCVPCLVLTAYYLIGVRRRENQRLVAEYEHQLETWDA